jgi:small-conductance mechanosensitive channel
LQDSATLGSERAYRHLIRSPRTEHAHRDGGRNGRHSHDDRRRRRDPRPDVLPGRLADREPRILLTEFGDSAVSFEESIWSEDPWSSRITLSALNEVIWWAFKDAGIVIAYPQMNVHIIRSAPIRRVADGE